MDKSPNVLQDKYIPDISQKNIAVQQISCFSELKNTACILLNQLPYQILCKDFLTKNNDETLSFTGDSFPLKKDLLCCCCLEAAKQAETCRDMLDDLQKLVC